MIEGVKTKDLKVIPDERGLLMEMMRCDDEFFQKFGQVYLSVVYPGVVKGWHYHKVQTDHFVIVKGMAKVVLHDSREDSPTKGETNEFFLGENNRKLVRENQALVSEIRAFHSNPRYIEKVARDELGMVGPDEIIYQFPEDKKSKKK